MKKTKFRRLAAMAASLLCCLIFTVPAYAQSNEPQPEATPAPVETEAEPETQNPFTPDGTGTVVDNATDEDGKEFYTITTADESVFYLVIDKQKTSENVYFLNTVTVDDLLPLAEQGKEPPKEVTPEPEPKPTEPVEEVPHPGWDNDDPCKGCRYYKECKGKKKQCRKKFRALIVEPRPSGHRGPKS